MARFFAALFALTLACSPSPTPPAQTPCDAAQARLDALGCASLNPPGATFGVWCARELARGNSVPTSCIASAPDCASAERCQ